MKRRTKWRYWPNRQRRYFVLHFQLMARYVRFVACRFQKLFCYCVLVCCGDHMIVTNLCVATNATLIAPSDV
jgi:hypothetical protein